jgi:hypothetical protein
MFFIVAIVAIICLPALNKPQVQAANVVSIKQAAIVVEADECVGMSAETFDRFKLVLVATAVVAAVFFFGA